MRGLRNSLAPLLVVAACLAVLSGCGGGPRKGEHAPVACREGAATFLDALRTAPGEVVLAGEAPISDCLIAGAEEGELADLGEGALDAAQELNREARAQPGGKANVELGYLIGAISRGSADTEGVHSTLLDRLTVAARYYPPGEPPPPAFRAAYAKGFAAGRDHG